MVWIYPEQIPEELKKQFKFTYILFGNDYFLLKDSQINILKKITIPNCSESYHIELNINSDWNEIFNFCKNKSLFATKKILSLIFPQNYPITYLNKNAHFLSSLTHDQLILIILIYTSDTIKQHNVWMSFFNKSVVFINCMKPEYIRLRTWIMNQAKQMQLIIENLACQLLCYYYEGNIALLQQILQHLSLIYPDGNLNFIRVNNLITDSSFFDFNHWIEAILIGKKQRANRILKQLEYLQCDFKILLYRIQREILILIKIKNSITEKKSFYTLIKEHKIYTKHHHTILLQATKRLHINQLYQAIKLLTQMELNLHQKYKCISKFNFELLTEILCSTQQINPAYHVFIKDTL